MAKQKKILALILLLISLGFLYYSTRCAACFGCDPTSLETCSFVFLLIFLCLFAWAIGIFRANKKNLTKKRK